MSPAHEDLLIAIQSQVQDLVARMRGLEERLDALEQRILDGITTAVRVIQDNNHQAQRTLDYLHDLAEALRRAGFRDVPEPPKS